MINTIPLDSIKNIRVKILVITNTWIRFSARKTKRKQLLLGEVSVRPKYQQLKMGLLQRRPHHKMSTII
jgi:hypothetical protein